MNTVIHAGTVASRNPFLSYYIILGVGFEYVPLDVLTYSGSLPRAMHCMARPRARAELRTIIALYVR